MNKNERNVLCILISQWEFSKDTSAPAAAATANCARVLQTEFSISDEEMSPYRAMVIGKLFNDESDDFYDLLCDAISDDYLGVLNMIDQGEDALRNFVERYKVSFT